METKFKDVAHLYYGVEAVGTDMRDGESTRGKIIEINQSGITILENPFDFEFLVQEVKPILSRLEDMTEDDMKEVVSYLSGSEKVVGWDTFPTAETSLMRNAKVTAYLLSKGYDLFQLIESDEAIDRKTIGNSQTPQQ